MSHRLERSTEFGQLVRKRNTRWTCVTFVAAALLILLRPYEARAALPVEVLHYFDPYTEGFEPSGLIQASDGNFYGTTRRVLLECQCPNVADYGTIYRVTPAGVLTVLHIFNQHDGDVPESGLIQASNGYLYGSTTSGGTFRQGVVYRIGLDGSFTVIHEFSFADGSFPGTNRAALVQATDGYLYGTTYYGGARNLGTAFRMSLDGAVTTIHAFAGGAFDAALPASALVEYGGAFYGMSFGGGTTSRGTIYRMTLSGEVTVLHSFDLRSGPFSPEDVKGLVLASDGNFYGTAQNSGGIGLFYRLSPSGAFTVLREFPFFVEAPTATLIEGPDGAFYAAGRYGIFRLTRAGKVTTIYSFNDAVEGDSVAGALVQGVDGNLYGTAANPGPLASFAEHFSAPESGSFFRMSLSPWVGRAAGRGDVDGDFASELTVFRPSNGTWYTRYSSQAYSAATPGVFQWGVAGDVPLAGDFDGDGKTDLTVWRPSDGTWYIRYSTRNYSVSTPGVFQWGWPDDIPIVGDFDGDGKTDLTVWRPSNGTWYIRYSTQAYSVKTSRAFQWGTAGDIPIPGDFDGDGNTDLAVWRPSDGTWYVWHFSPSPTYAYYQWGVSGDVPLSGDFDGDGKTDLAVFRPSIGGWFIIYSGRGYADFYAWGTAGDVPMVIDADGDGLADLAVYRPSIGGWYIRYSSQSYSVATSGFFQWGLSDDVLARQ